MSGDWFIGGDFSCSLAQMRLRISVPGDEAVWHTVALQVSVGQASCLSMNDRQDACPTKMAGEVDLSTRSDDTCPGTRHQIYAMVHEAVSFSNTVTYYAMRLLRRDAPRNDTPLTCHCEGSEAISENRIHNICATEH
jgi:hypothetical protein